MNLKNLTIRGARDWAAYRAHSLGKKSFARYFHRQSGGIMGLLTAGMVLPTVSDGYVVPDTYFNEVKDRLDDIDPRTTALDGGGAYDDSLGSLSTRFNNLSIVNVKDYGATGDGGTPEDTAIANAIASLTGDDLLLFPRGVYVVTSAKTFTALERITVRGEGATIISDYDGTLFQFTTCQDILVEGIRFEINGAPADGSRRTLSFTDPQNVRVKDCEFIDGVERPIYIVTTGASISERIHVSRCLFEGSISNNANGSFADIYIQGNAQSIDLRENRHIAHATSPINIGEFVATTSGFAATDVRFVDNYVEGCEFFGLGGTQEDPTGAFSTGKWILRGNFIKNCNAEGIKLKNVRQCIVTENHVEGCNTVPEDVGSGLTGGIFLNGTEDGICSHNIVKNDGTQGIRVNGQNPEVGGTIAGEGRARHTIIGNVIQNCASEGIHVSQRCYENTIVGNTIEDCNIGIRLLGDTNLSGNETDRVLNTVIQGNTIKDCAARGILAERVERLTIQGNMITKPGGFGILVDTFEDVLISGNVCFEATGDGIRVTTGNGATITGNRSGNRPGVTTQQYGITLGAGTSNVSFVGNALQNNALSAIQNNANHEMGNIAGTSDSVRTLDIHNNRVQVKDFMDFVDRGAAVGGATGVGRVYVRLVGGKHTLYVRFPTGGEIQLAQEV